MTPHIMTPITIAAVVIALLAISFAVWALIERRKTQRLRSKFGPEYDRTLQQAGNPQQAEAVLEKREKRVAKYHLRALSPRETERFSHDWRIVQEHFVDDPGTAVAEADKLIDEAMQARGYPISDFEEQAEDLSVDYPSVVQHYRAAHAIDIRQNGNRADTEELRKAMRHYHALFDQVIGAETVHHQEVR